ncbi:uncharacterized protein LOC110982408 [Acanthaster planci]|uniref:Uncharacterized protein LOC110982408 n=1 Tax=Acanthaster planci TaxID=133434 RepID=A0A8B7YVG2_ACAPL|nr:uncharacterized protein LOC110982408 [Acanthaster planci]
MKWTLLFVSFLVCLGASQARKCYVCATGTCNDPFSKADATETDCGSQFDTCVKQKVGDIVTGRTCGASDTCTDLVSGGPNSCRTISVPLVGDTTTCCCNTDLCNSATTRQVSYVLLSAMLLVIKAAF